MSSRATKKKIWRLKNMTNGEWLNMLKKMSTLENMEFGKWCYTHGLAGEYHSYIQACKNGIRIS